MFITAFSCIEATYGVNILYQGVGFTVHLEHLLFRIGNLSLQEKIFG